MLGAVRRKIARPLLHRLRRPIVLRRIARASEVRLLGHRLRTDPDVFHPTCFSSSRLLAEHLVERPLRGRRVLDMGTGAGPIAITVAAAGAHVTACDINPAMLAVGRDRAVNRGLLKGLTWTTGDAEALPFPDRSFDGYTIAFGLRNVTDIDKALTEAYRVLRPGGRFYCLEFSKVKSAPIGRVYDAYSERALPFFGRLVARDAESYRYLHESIRRFPAQRVLAERMRKAGFANVAWRDMTLGVVALHSGWRI